MRQTMPWVLSLAIVAAAGCSQLEKAPVSPKKPEVVRVAGIVLKWVRAEKEINFERAEPLIREAADKIYRFVFLTPPNRTGQLREALQETTYSFRRLSADEAAAIRPLRIDIVTVRTGDTLESLGRRMATSLPLETFQVLNGLSPTDRLTPGRKVKLVTD